MDAEIRGNGGLEVERDLRASERRFASAFEDAPSGFSFTQPDGSLVHANATFAEMLGYSVAEIEGLTVAELTHPDDRAETARLIKATLAGDVNGFKVDTRYLHKDGSAIWTTASVTLLRDEQGRPENFMAVVSDTSARKVAEEALKASEARFRGLFETALIGFALHEIVLDESGVPVDYVYVEANRAFSALTGLDAAAVAGRRASAVFADLSEPPYLALYGQVALGGAPQRFETYFEPLDRHYDIQVFSPQPGQFATVFLDVTSRVRAQRTLESFFDSQSVGLGILDRELRYVRVNEVLADINQVAISDHLGRTVQDVLPEHAADIVPALDRVLRGEAVDGLEVRGGTSAEPDLEHHWLASYFPVAEEGGPVEAIGLVAIDVTRRHDAERDLEESRRFLQRALDVTPDLIYIYDVAERRSVFSNRGTVETLGYTPEQILEMGSGVAPRLLHPDDVAVMTRHHLKAGSLADGQTLEMEYRMKRRDGSWCRLRSRDAVFRRGDDGAVTQLIGTALDITEQRAAEDARHEAERELAAMNVDLERRVVARTLELEAANTELEAFSYSVSHDLRAPLRALDGFSMALLEDYSEQLDATGKDYLARVRAAAQRMGQLIDDLLALSRVARLDMGREKVDLSALARDVLADLSEEDPQRVVDVHVADGLVVDGDPALLRVVLHNLLSNAWKFTARKPEACIEVGVEWRDGRAAYFVRDDGAGFDATYVDKLFTPFQRLHSADEFPGTGIGLATVKRIVRRHGGAVWAEGAVDCGATFSFTLQ